MFVLHGNIYDLFPVQDGENINYVPLKTFLARRLFPERACLLFYEAGAAEGGGESSAYFLGGVMSETGRSQ